jgi:hypothetical protein
VLIVAISYAHRIVGLQIQRVIAQESFFANCGDQAMAHQAPEKDARNVVDTFERELLVCQFMENIVGTVAGTVIPLSHFQESS